MAAPRVKQLTDEHKERILNLVRSGVHELQAFLAIGISRRTYYRYREKAARGVRKWTALFADIEQAQAQAEAQDVVVTKRAVTPENVEVHCSSCGEPMRIDPITALALCDQITAAQSVKSSAASIAFQRLMLRFPQRWQQRVVHEISTAHDRFLDVAQRVLAPEVFELLLAAYAQSEGAGETDGDPSAENQLH
jgi:hypothetical protein